MRLPILMLATAAALPAALLLGACDKQGTSISIRDEGGNTLASADGDSGEVKLDVAGFSGGLKLPKIKLNADNFDLNGVHLYPGSAISSFDIDAGKGKNGNVRVGFTSPAEPATVRDWFAERLTKADYRVTADGTGLTGLTDEKQPFRLQLEPAGSGKARGTITIG